MVSNEAVTVAFGLITAIFSWFIHNYQQKEDQIKKREKIVDKLVKGFAGVDQMLTGHQHDLFKKNPEKIENIRSELNLNFKLAMSFVRLYFLKTSDNEKWLALDKELEKHFGEIFPKYTQAGIKPDLKTFRKDFNTLMDYLPKFIDLLKYAKFYNRLIVI